MITTIGFNHDSSGTYVITFDAEALTLTTTLDGLPYITQTLEVADDADAVQFNMLEPEEWYNYSVAPYSFKMDHYGIGAIVGTTVYRIGETVETESIHVGHVSTFGTHWCDTCNSPYCDLA